MSSKTAPIPTAPVDTNNPSQMRWVMIGFAFFATLINYLDRQVLSVAITSPDFKAAVPLTTEDYGNVTAAFMLLYAISNGLSGPFIDKVGTKIGYAACMLWWSLAGIVHIFARGALSLGIFRSLLGMGEAGNWPAAAKLVGEWFPPRERALASGIFNSGASIGAVASTPIIAWMVLQWGWKSAFVAMGALGLLWIVGWWLTYFTPKAAATEEKTAPRVSTWSIFSTRFVLVFTLSKVFMDPVWYFFVFWFPKYLSDVHHLGLAQIGKVGWVPYATAAVGNIAGGYLTGVLIRSGIDVPRARKMGTAVFALLMTASIPAIFSSNAWLAIGLIAVATFGYTGYTANTLAFPPDVFPKSAVASVWGLASMGSGFGGMIFMHYSGVLIAKHGYTPVFIGYGIMPLIALVLVVFAIGPLKRHPRFAGSENAAA